MTEHRWKKARWIAKQLEGDYSVDDVYDVILGNLTRPWEFYSEVNTLAREYDKLYAAGMEKNG